MGFDGGRHRKFGFDGLAVLANSLELRAIDHHLSGELEGGEQHGDTVAVAAFLNDHRLKTAHWAIGDDNAISGSELAFDRNDIDRFTGPELQLINNGRIDNRGEVTETHDIDHVGSEPDSPELQGGIEAAEQIAREQRTEDSLANPTDNPLAFQTWEVSLQAQRLFQVESRVLLFKRFCMEAVPVHSVCRIVSASVKEIDGL